MDLLLYTMGSNTKCAECGMSKKLILVDYLSSTSATKLFLTLGTIKNF